MGFKLNFEKFNLYRSCIGVGN